MYFFNDTLTNGYNIEIINLLSVLSIISGILVITTKNPIVSVLFLITLFFNVACFLIVLGLNFIGLSYLLVYVGAVSILFLFILMLINIRISELLSKTKNSIPLIFLVFISLSFVLLNILPLNYNNFFTENTDLNFNKIFLNVNNENLLNTMYYKVNAENINYTSSFFWDGNMIEFNPIASIGSIMYTSYPMWLLGTSLILLLSMIGVIVITLNTSDYVNNNSHNVEKKELYSHHNDNNMSKYQKRIFKIKLSNMLVNFIILLLLIVFIIVVFYITYSTEMNFINDLCRSSTTHVVENIGHNNMSSCPKENHSVFDNYTWKNSLLSNEFSNAINKEILSDFKSKILNSNMNYIRDVAKEAFEAEWREINLTRRMDLFDDAIRIKELEAMELRARIAELTR